MNLTEVSERNPITARPTEPVAMVALKMKDHDFGAVVVTIDGKVAGIITDRDIAIAVASEEFSVDVPVSDIMTSEVKTIWNDQGIFNTTQYLRDHHVRRLPIIDRHDKLVGMVTADDLYGLIARETFNIAQSLEPALGSRV